MKTARVLGKVGKKCLGDLYSYMLRSLHLHLRRYSDFQFREHSNVGKSPLKAVHKNCNEEENVVIYIQLESGYSLLTWLWWTNKHTIYLFVYVDNIQPIEIRIKACNATLPITDLFSVNTTFYICFPK